MRQPLTPWFALNMNFKSSQHFAPPQTGDARSLCYKQSMNVDQLCSRVAACPRSAQMNASGNMIKCRSAFLRKRNLIFFLPNI